MKEKVVTDLNGVKLIIKYRKSAVFLLKEYKDEDLILHRCGETFIDGQGLGHGYEFSRDQFIELYESLKECGSKAWSNITPKEADSFGSDYDDYYDKDFDNNGSLSLTKNRISIEGPYAQVPNKEKLTRLIKFNKRKFEAFMFDYEKILKKKTDSPASKNQS